MRNTKTDKAIRPQPFELLTSYITFLRHPGLDATNWRAESAIRFGVILRKVWGGSHTWAGVRAQYVLMSVWRTCWQQGLSAPDSLSQLLRGPPTQDCAIPGLNAWPLMRQSR